MATSRWSDVLDAAVGLLRAESGYRAPSAAGTGIPVFSGSDFSDADVASEPVVLLVGWSSSGSGSTAQTVTTMAAGTRPREESGEVRCTAVANNDSGASARAAVFAVLASVESLTRSNPDLGLGSASGFKFALCPGTAPVDVSLESHSQGHTAQLVFSIQYEARL